MSTPRQYSILIDRSPVGLEYKVEDALKDGWTLQGGVCVYESEYYENGETVKDTTFAQALTHTNEPPE
jgi:Domain of unknown function (DUF1737)